MGTTKSCIGVEIDVFVIRAVILDPQATKIIGYAEVKRSTGDSGSILDNLAKDLKTLWGKLPEKFKSNVRVAVSFGVSNSGVRKSEISEAWVEAQAVKTGEAVKQIDDNGRTIYCPESSIQELQETLEKAEIQVDSLELAPLSALRVMEPDIDCVFSLGSGIWWKVKAEGGKVVEAFEEEILSDDRSLYLTTPDKDEQPLKNLQDISVNDDLLNTFKITKASLAVAVGAAKGLNDNSSSTSLLSQVETNAIDLDKETTSIDLSEPKEGLLDQPTSTVETASSPSEQITSTPTETINADAPTLSSPVTALLDQNPKNNNPVSASAVTSQHPIVEIDTDKELQTPSTQQPFKSTISNQADRPNPTYKNMQYEQEPKKSNFLKNLLLLLSVVAIALAASFLTILLAQRNDWFGLGDQEASNSEDDNSDSAADDTGNDLAKAPEGSEVEPVTAVFKSGNQVDVSGNVPNEADSAERIKQLRDLLGADFTINNNLTINEKAPNQAGYSVSLISIEQEGTLFASGSSDLAIEQSQVLDFIAKTAASQPELLVQVVGHTDSDGQASKNRVLGLQRAEAVVDFLLENDVKNTQILLFTAGEAYNKYPNIDEAGRSGNRRIEIELIPVPNSELEKKVLGG